MTDRQLELPAIGSKRRQAIEAEAIEHADELLGSLEHIGEALMQLRIQREIEHGHEAARELTDHVHQVWIGRILR